MFVFANPPDTSDATAINNFLLSSLGDTTAIKGVTTVSDEFAIDGTYCQPGPGIMSREVLQILVHGVTYN